MKRSIPLFIICLLVPVLSSAQTVELTPFVGYQFGGEFRESWSDDWEWFDRTDFNLDESESYGLIADFSVAGDVQVELLYEQQETRIERFNRFDEDPADLDLRYMHAGVLWQFRREGARPFIAASIGGTRFDFVEGSDETSFSTSFAGGVKAMVNDNLGFRFEGRLYTTFLDEDDQIVCDDEACLFYEDDVYLNQWELKFGVTLAF